MQETKGSKKQKLNGLLQKLDCAFSDSGEALAPAGPSELIAKIAVVLEPYCRTSGKKTGLLLQHSSFGMTFCKGFCHQ